MCKPDTRTLNQRIAAPRGSASAIITAANLPDFGYPAAVADKVAFARAGIMHDFSYLGGFLGILTASLYLIATRVRLARRRRKGLNASR